MQNFVDISQPQTIAEILRKTVLKWWPAAILNVVGSPVSARMPNVMKSQTAVYNNYEVKTFNMAVFTLDFDRDLSRAKGFLIL